MTKRLISIIAGIIIFFFIGIVFDIGYGYGREIGLLIGIIFYLFFSDLIDCLIVKFEKDSIKWTLTNKNKKY